MASFQFENICWRCVENSKFCDSRETTPAPRLMRKTFCGLAVSIAAHLLIRNKSSGGFFCESYLSMKSLRASLQKNLRYELHLDILVEVVLCLMDNWSSKILWEPKLAVLKYSQLRSLSLDRPTNLPSRPSHLIYFWSLLISNFDCDDCFRTNATCLWPDQNSHIFTFKLLALAHTI